MIGKIITVFLLSTVELYAAITAGNIAGLNKWVILITSILGGVIGVFVAYFFGQKIEKYIQEKIKKNKDPKPKTGFIYTIWKKYGLYGLGVFGTFIFGAPIAIGVGVGFNADLKKLVQLCLITVVVRCFAFTLFADVVKNWIKYYF
jgi:membrane protein YqaA with SNARE-associated domain